MKVKLSGDRVRQIREALGMSAPQFSTVIAVHPGTVHRWEAAGASLIPIDGVAAGLLAVLDQRVNHHQMQAADFRPDKVGQEVIQALVVGGALLALGLLIGELVGKGKR
ncbi:MAG: helix-turn-helix domain-containing protein [Phycisphaerales bacterium]